MLAHVQTFLLLLHTHPQTHGRLDDPEKDHGESEREHSDRHNTHHLVPQLRSPLLAPNSPTASVPQIPHTKCTEIAPTGSSIRILSKNMTDNTTNTPAINPMIAALIGAI
jgi:hypothetical protein